MNCSFLGCLEVVQSLINQISYQSAFIKLVFVGQKSHAIIPTHPTQVRHILTLFPAHWLLTLADRLSPLSVVANPRKAPTSKSINVKRLHGKSSF